MSQNAARRDPHARPGDEDVAHAQARQPEHEQGVRPRQPVGEPAGDGGMGPDEPDESEFELIGDNDLGAADLGPIAPMPPTRTRLRATQENNLGAART